MPCASRSELRQPPRLEAACNGRLLLSTVHTACHRNLHLEKTDMQGSWTVSAAPHKQTEAIGAAVIDSTEEAKAAKGRMLPAARWKRGGHGENTVSRDLCRAEVALLNIPTRYFRHNSPGQGA